MADITRNLGQKASKLLDMFPVLCVLGARQVGKTTLAKQVRPNWLYVDLEKQSDFERIRLDPVYFFEQYNGNIIIDEAQVYPEIFNVLRGVIDANRDLKNRFILTGSSSPELLTAISETLAGRIATINLGTLKANEIYNEALSNFYNIFTNKKINKDDILNCLTTRLTEKQMQQCWLLGGYPEPRIHNTNELFYQQWMENYFNTYIYRDVAKLFPRLNKTNYQRFIRILGQLSSTIINQNDIARALEVSAPTVKEYLDIAAGTYIWRQQPSYEANGIKSIIKMPKGHIADTGLLHYFLGIQDFDSLFFNPIAGRSFESFVIEEIIKGIESSFLTNWRVHYYRTKSGVEIDLIIDSPNGIIPIEIKQGKTIQRSDLKHLESFISANRLPFGLIVNQSSTAEWLTHEILQIPVTYL